MTHYPLMAVISHLTRLKIYGANPIHIFGTCEDHFIFGVKINTEEYNCKRDRLFRKGMCSESRDLFNIGK